MAALVLHGCALAAAVWAGVILDHLWKAWKGRS